MNTQRGEQRITGAGLSQQTYPTNGGKRDNVVYLVLSGERSGVRGGGVRGTAGLGAMEAAGTKP